MMKVTCNHCAAKNDLGRMFCMSCGKRMTITNADVNEAAAEKAAFNPLTLVKPLLLTLILLAAAAALVPFRPVAPAESDGLALRVKGKYQQLLRAATGRETARVTFDADEINMFMKMRNTGTGTNTPVFNLQLKGNHLIVLQQFLVSPANAVVLRFSRRSVCAGSGRALVSGMGYFGHLPLPGPLKTVVTQPMRAAFVLTPSEQTIEKRLTEILIRDGKLEIAVGP